MTRSRTRRSVPALVLLTALLLVALAPRPASACSCAFAEPEEAIAGADAAFVGRVADRHDDRWTFEVEAVLAGDLSDPLEVRAQWDDGASCGLTPVEDGRYGLVLHRGQDGWWEASLCGQYDADVLLAAGEPRPSLPASDAPTAPDPGASGSNGPGVAGLAIVAATVLGSLTVLGGAVLWDRRRPTDA